MLKCMLVSMPGHTPVHMARHMSAHASARMFIGAHIKLKPADDIVGYCATLHCGAFQHSAPLAGSTPYFSDLEHQ